jgi:exopolysaccharide production protein ExoQ
MSAAALTAEQLLLSGDRTRRDVAPRWLMLGTGFIVGLVFFVAGHDFHVSLAESYTQNAEEMEIAASGGNNLRRAAFVVVGAWGCLLLAIARTPLRVDPLLASGMGLLLGLAAMSFVWADDPGMCLRRLLTLLCGVTAAVGVARTLSLREISWLAVWILGSLAIVGVLTEISLGTFKPWAADYRFAGTVHPNTQGPALAMLCLAAFTLAQDGSRASLPPWLVFVAGLGLLLLTKSRTTTAAIVVALAAVQFVKTKLTTKLAGAMACAGLGGLALWLLFVFGFDPLTDFRDALLLGRAEESDTLSGRAFIWPELLGYASSHVWLGYGYESFWTAERIDQISSALGWGLREAHNAYLEVVLWLGVAGLTLLLINVAAGLSASVRQWRLSGDSVFLLPAGMLVFGLINAGFESGMVVMSLTPFLLGCMLMRLALFCQTGATAGVPA